MKLPRNEESWPGGKYMKISSITSDMKSLVDKRFYSRDRAGFTYSKMLLTLGLPFSF